MPDNEASTFSKVVKAVKQNYSPNAEVLALMESFRRMVNDCIRIGLRENVTSRRSLTYKAYHELATYKISASFRLTAIGKAVGMLRNYRKTIRKKPDAKRPYATRLMLVDCYSFKIENGTVRLTLEKGKRVFVPLSTHTQQVLADPSITARSVTLTDRALSISYAKEVRNITPEGMMGIDRNLNNVTTATSNGKVTMYDLSEATKIKALYRLIKSHFKRNDARIRKRIYGKYGLKQRNKVSQVLHHASKEIVQQAKAQKLGIVMENLKGIREGHRRGNRKGPEYRSRMNSWSFYELQRQIEYKARWEGLPVIYVSEYGTSSICAICGSQILERAERKVYCPTCQKYFDRDENAAKNILERGLRFEPDGLARKRCERNENNL